MKTLSIDIETYSSVNLAKSGVYSYVESPDFEILLFGYSIDGGEVQVVDLASGDKLPSEVIAALTDDTVIKWAFNANFERICLSRFLGLPTGEYINPASWNVRWYGQRRWDCHCRWKASVRCLSWTSKNSPMAKT